jgi:hypothetical protein
MLPRTSELAGPCEYGNEPSGSIKGEELICKVKVKGKIVPVLN